MATREVLNNTASSAKDHAVALLADSTNAHERLSDLSNLEQHICRIPALRRRMDALLASFMVDDLPHFSRTILTASPVRYDGVKSMTGAYFDASLARGHWPPS